jgi:hypothetical protein
VPRPKPFGDEHLNGLAEEFGAGIAENPLRLSVNHLDLAGRADHDHGVRRRINHAPEPFFAFATSLLDGLTR